MTEDCLKADSCLSWMTNTRQLILFLFYTLLKVSAINSLKSMWFLPLNSDISSWPHSTVLTLRSSAESGGVKAQAAGTERGAQGSGRSGGRRGWRPPGGGWAATHLQQTARQWASVCPWNARVRSQTPVYPPPPAWGPAPSACVSSLSFWGVLGLHWGCEDRNKWCKEKPVSLQGDELSQPPQLRQNLNFKSYSCLHREQIIVFNNSAA